MTCPGFDWKEFVLDEAAPAERRRMAGHLEGCVACRGEVEQLQLTLGLLKQLPEQAPPRRIAFVSDPVFEPSGWRRFWQSGPRLGFASAALLALAIVSHGWLARPALAPPATTAAVQPAQVEELVQAEVARRLPAALDERVKAQLEPAVRQLDARLERYQKGAAAQRSADMKDVELAMGYLQRKMNNMVLTAARYGGD